MRSNCELTEGNKKIGDGKIRDEAKVKQKARKAMSKSIKSIEEFIAWVKKLDGRLLLYRGLANADWEVESSAYRRIKESQGASLPPIVFQNYIAQLLESAGLHGFRERQLSDLELMAELQHYGAATCLIDFTTNALIALWFACEE